MTANSTFCKLHSEGKEKEAKAALRGSVGPESELETSRSQNWRKILELRTACNQVDTSSLYWDTVETCFGTKSLPTKSEAQRLPSCVDQRHCPSYGLENKEKAMVARLITVLAYNCPDATFIPLLYPITAVILKQGFSEEDTYSFISMIVSPPPSQKISYFTQTRSGWDVLCFSLKPLALKYTKAALSFIESEAGQEDSDGLLQSWPWWIFEHLELRFLVRVMDCYLYEGHKVVFRTALALLKLFHKEASKKAELHKTLKNEGIFKTFAHFCKNLKISPGDLLKTAFKIPRFSKTDIEKLTKKLEMESRANKLQRKSRSNEELTTDGVGVHQHAFSTPQHRPSGTYPIHHLQSELLSKDQMMSIWDHLPERMTSIKPTLAYSSNEHGVSLTTFFTRVDKYEPTVIVIRTTKSEVFGAYCSISWAQRNTKDDKGLRMRYFGTGETFLFKLKDGSGFSKYEWVNKDDSSSEDEDSDKKDRSKELFMSADNTMITIGGGGGTAIYLDENLRFGQTEKCSTFENEPLCSERDFTVSAIEVFGLNDISW